MKKAPAFQFYADKFITGTSHFSAEQVGAYIRLLCFQWETGYIPADVTMQARIAGCNKKAITEVLKKFVNTDKGFINERLETARQEQLKYKESKSNAGKIGNQKRWKKDNNVIAEVSHCDNSAISKNIAEPIANNRSSSSTTSSNNIMYVKAREATCTFFGVSEIYNFKAFKEISDALEIILETEKLEYYLQQLQHYQIYKETSGQQKCKHSTWLFGELPDQKNILNGHWCRTDYKTLNKQEHATTKKFNGPTTKGGATKSIRSGNVKDFGKIQL